MEVVQASNKKADIEHAKCLLKIMGHGCANPTSIDSGAGFAKSDDKHADKSEITRGGVYLAMQGQLPLCVKKLYQTIYCFI